MSEQGQPYQDRSDIEEGWGFSLNWYSRILAETQESCKDEHRSPQVEAKLRKFSAEPKVWSRGESLPVPPLVQGKRRSSFFWTIWVPFSIGHFLFLSYQWNHLLRLGGKEYFLDDVNHQAFKWGGYLWKKEKQRLMIGATKPSFWVQRTASWDF